MNKLHVLISNNTINLFQYSIKTIKNYKNDLDYENIVIVPDKLSLFAEQSIFNVLNIDVYFNISVMGISKFVNLIFDKNNLKSEQCTNLESKLLVLRAIQNTCTSFKCFSKNYTLGFVDEMYAKIEQIKSSNCDINSLIDENASIGTKLKFEDIKLIFCEYEKLRAGKLDSGDLLSVFNQICNEVDYLKKCNVFFMGFDSLTKQGIEVLKNVSKFANFTQISIVAPYNQSNFNIYDQSFLDSVINIATQEKIECETKWLNLPFNNNDKNIVLNNLFGKYKDSFKQNEFYKIFRTSSVLEEIELCVKQINYMLKTKTTKFNDFAICCNSGYHKLIENRLNRLNIDTYCDSKYNLFYLEPVKYIYNIFLFQIYNDNDLLQNIISNDFCDLQKKEKMIFLTELKKFGSLNNYNLFSKNKSDSINNYLKNITNNSLKNKNNYSILFKNIIQNTKIIEKIAKKCEIFEKNSDILLCKLFSQIEDKLNEVINTIEDILNSDNITAEDYVSILEKVLKETEISSVPSTTNQVFIGDEKSFYYDKKYIFVLGANEGELPTTLNDYGLITDKEINSDTIKAKLEPTTKIINKRNKYKFFEILLSATENCFLFYHAFEDGNKSALKSDFLTELEKLFCISEIQAAQLKIIYEDKNISKICFNIEDSYNANLLLRENQRFAIQNLVNYALVKNNNLYKKNKENIVNIDFSKLIFVNNKASITTIEKYNSCPKSAFLSNGLKLQPIKKDKIEANIIGTFIHEVAEKFVRNNINNLGNIIEIDKKVNIIIENILKDENYYSLLLPENKFLLGLLKKESIRFCEFINYEQSVSKFKPRYTEKYFGGQTGFGPITISVDDEKYFISGVVDRIDMCDDSFRIIDYKTGNTTNSKGMDYLYYGTKIQLFVYAKAIKENIDKKLFGAFYLPISNSFSKNGENNYSFSGFFEDNIQKVLFCDSNLSTENPQSKILNVSLAKVSSDGEIKLKRKQNILSKENLNACLEYSVAIVKETIKNIKMGYIECSPMKDKCKYCEYNQICKNAFNELIERTENVEVSKEKYMEIDYGN